MSYPDLMTEHAQLLAVIHADIGVAGTTYRTPYFSMQQTHKLLVSISCGDMAATATFDVQLLQATDAAAAGAKIIAAKAITQLTAANGDGNDACAINLRTEEMDVANDFDHVSVRVRVGAANVDGFCVMVHGEVPRYAPVTQTPWTEVIP